MSVDNDYDGGYDAEDEQVVLVGARSSARPPRQARPVAVPTTRPRSLRVLAPPPATSLGSGDLVVDAAMLGPKKPLLVRLLRLHYVRPTGWQRAAVGDLPILVAVLLVLGDLATAWTVLVLPVVVLALVKFHDVIESRLAPVPEMSQSQVAFGDPHPRR